MQQRLGLGDHRGVPEPRVLPAERHVGAVGVAAGRPARLGVQHQREEAERLGRLRQQAGDEAREVDRLAGQVAAGGVGAVGVGPALGEGGVDRLEHRVEPRRRARPARGWRRGCRPARILVLARTRRLAIAAGETRKAEAMRPASRPSTTCSISGARIAGLERGVGAGEEQRRAAGRAGRARPRRRRAPRRGARASPAARGAGAAAAVAVDQPAPGDGHQPGLGVVRAAARRPVGERGGEGVGERVLGRRHVAAARGEQGHELAVAAARDGVGRLARRALRRGARDRSAGSRPRVRYIAQTGRSSTTPWLAVGQRAAQAIAASRSGASIR